MANLVLGVSGSIAAYRAADLARDLMRAGFTVRVCLTDAAQRFVTPVLFETLTGQPCLQDVFEEPQRGRMAHIDWAREADLIVVAPATANTIARIAHGEAEDMLTTLVIASRAPLVLAPAMNPQMYAADTTRQAIEALRARAARIVEPAEGDVACGEQGQGKLASNAEIVAAALEVHRRAQTLQGQRVLITSGPTREPIDGVRYLTNRSSGKMGAALARAALLMGAEVDVVAGPSAAAYPLDARVHRVQTARQMLDAALPLASEADLIIGAAAVADYRPEITAEGKLRRGEATWSLALVPNPDVLKALAGVRKPGALAVGFAAEPNEGLDYARAKLAKKGLDAVAVNDIGRSDIGFDAEQNELVVLWPSGEPLRSGRRSKLACALWLLEHVADRRQAP